MDDPFRQGVSREPCAECREPTDAAALARCPRCEAPLCPAHAPAAADRRCGGCERGFALATTSLRDRRPFHRTPVAARALAAGLVVAAVVAAMWPGTAGYVVFGIVAGATLGPVEALWFRGRMRRARRRFLAERAAHELPPAPRDPRLLLLGAMTAPDRDGSAPAVEDPPDR